MMLLYNTVSSIFFIQFTNGVSDIIARGFNNTIDQILTKNNGNGTEIDVATALTYLIDNQTDIARDGEPEIDASLLEASNLKNIVKIAQSKHKMVESEYNNSLRYGYMKEHEAYWEHEIVINKTFDLMTQSVYATRYRLQDTKPIRKEYANDVPYKIAVMYGALMQLRLKMDNIYATLRHLGSVKFIHYMTLYERVVMATVDVDALVDRIIAEYSLYIKSFQGNAAGGVPEDLIPKWYIQDPPTEPPTPPD